MIGVFVLGLFIGAALGVLIMCLCIITKDIDNELKKLEGGLLFFTSILSLREFYVHTA